MGYDSPLLESPPPSVSPPPFSTDEYRELLNDTLARIEALKITSYGGYPGSGGGSELIRELTIIRSAVLQLAHWKMNAGRAGIIDQQNLDGSELELEGVLGHNPEIARALQVIRKIAPTDMTMLLEGETGVGKELFARIIHLNSPRQKFVAVNCGALPGELIESELFGHVRGAFTGASGERKGKFEEADGGTIFLDEIGEMGLQAQVRLLRVLEVGEIQKVGSDKFHHVSVRVIAATNRNLREMVRHGVFREDLYYRLSMCPISIPPLRQRRDEIPILLEHFVDEVSARYGKQPPQLSDELKELLFEHYGYPGNIRELKNLAQYLTFMADGERIGVDELPPHLREHEEEGHALPVAHVRDEAERAFLHDLLVKHRGCIKPLCEELKLSRSRIYQMLKKHGIDPASYRDRPQT